MTRSSASCHVADIREEASIARDPSGHVRLFVNGVGKHQFELQLTAAVPAAAALQTLNIALPVSTEAGDTLVPQYGRTFLIQVSAGF